MLYQGFRRECTIEKGKRTVNMQMGKHKTKPAEEIMNHLNQSEQLNKK